MGRLIPRKIRVSLSEEDFKSLTSGGVVAYGNVEISLQDIGFHAMLESVYNSVEEANDGEEPKFFCDCGNLIRNEEEERCWLCKDKTFTLG